MTSPDEAPKAWKSKAKTAAGLGTGGVVSLGLIMWVSGQVGDLRKEGQDSVTNLRAEIERQQREERLLLDARLTRMETKQDKTLELLHILRAKRARSTSADDVASRPEPVGGGG